jgi:hypothetical protein
VRFVQAGGGLVLAALLALWGQPGVAASSPADTVILQGLDKITARVTTIEAPVGKPVTFGSLSITARHCDKNSPEETPEAAAFLEIVDAKPGEAPVKLFSGWMFASSPAVSALEHPVYDVWVIDCKNAAKSGAATSP